MIIFWELFWNFLQIGLFSFDEEYAAIPLIQNQVVTGYNWLSISEFTYLIIISQMTPEPLYAINSTTFGGIKISDSIIIKIA